MMLREMRFALISGLLLTVAANAIGTEVKIQSSVKSPEVQYAVGRLRLALAETDELRAGGQGGSVRQMSLKVDAAKSDDDGFELTRRGTTLLVHGDSARGAMYGVLDIAEQIRLGASWATIHAHRVIPTMKFRA